MQTFIYDPDYMISRFSTSESEDDDDDYIVMEIRHDPTLEPVKEFEFPRLSSSSEEDHQSRTSPADDLFYMGNLLPLNRTPRLEMVQKIFEQNFDANKNKHLEEFCKMPLENTRFESSCKQEYFVEGSNPLIKEKSWTKKVMKWAKIKTALGQIRHKKVMTGSSRLTHRWSFSGACKMESKNNCDLQVPKRSLSESPSENPIQPAVAHCKTSLRHLILSNKDY